MASPATTSAAKNRKNPGARRGPICGCSASHSRQHSITTATEKPAAKPGTPHQVRKTKQAMTVSTSPVKLIRHGSQLFFSAKNVRTNRGFKHWANKDSEKNNRLLAVRIVAVQSKAPLP